MDESAGEIVGRAIAILDEEVRAWLEQRAVEGASERPSPADHRDEGGGAR